MQYKMLLSDYCTSCSCCAPSIHPSLKIMTRYDVMRCGKDQKNTNSQKQSSLGLNRDPKCKETERLWPGQTLFIISSEAHNKHLQALLNTEHPYTRSVSRPARLFRNLFPRSQSSRKPLPHHTTSRTIIHFPCRMRKLCEAVG